MYILRLITLLNILMFIVLEYLANRVPWKLISEAHDTQLVSDTRGSQQ